MTEAQCPRCHTPLEGSHLAAGRCYRCPTCHGAALGLCVFRDSLPKGVGQRIWLASEATGRPGQPCPFCAQPMRVTEVADSGGAGSVSVCRPCEVVWVTEDERTRLPGRLEGSPTAAGAPAPALAAPDRCPECGAPFEVTADGRCPYCRRQAEADPPVIVLVSDAGTADDGAGVAARARRFLLGG